MQNDRPDRRREKLSLLREKQENAQKHIDGLAAQIKKIEQDIHSDEVKRLDAVCAEKGITYDEICFFLKNINVSLSEMMKNISPKETVSEMPAKSEETILKKYIGEDDSDE